jgi:EAL domain-containing protein (putative c-di-GMP-specific phosphodiesterase class I)/CBS domain-containing protein
MMLNVSATDVRTHMSPPGNAAFHPIVDLDTGTVVAVETHIGPSAAGLPRDPLSTGEFVRDPGPPRSSPADEDVRKAIGAAHATARHGSRLPLQIVLRAETVAAGQEPLMRLHNGLRDAGRRPQEVIVCMSGGFVPALRPAVAASLHGLRSAGYLVGFAGLGTAHAPLDLLVEGTPYLVRLDAELTRQAATDQRKSVLVEALVGLAHRVGTHVQAAGVSTADQLVHLRELGVRMAQGPVLAGPGWRPGGRVTVPMPVRDEDSGHDPSGPSRRHGRGHADLGPRVSEFTLPAVTMGLNTTADQVLEVLSAERGTTSVVLVDESQRPRFTIDRTRFLLAISGAYGHALHAHKPASRLADAPRVVPKTVPAIAALRAAGKESERVYDDLVVTDELGRVLGVIRVSDLIRSLSP